MNHRKNPQLQAILSIFVHLFIYIIFVVASWIYTGSYYIHFFTEDNLRIMKTSLWILATWRLLFLIDYELAKLLRSLIAGAYLFSISNLITQCFRYTATDVSFYPITQYKVILALIPFAIYSAIKIWNYFKYEYSIIKQLRKK